MDNNYYSHNGKENPIGGLLGLQVLEPEQTMSDYWLKILIIGQYFGVGQRRSFGLGRYILELASGENTLRRVFPAQPILADIMAKENLDLALAHNHQDEYDNNDTDETRLTRIVEQISNDKYQAPDLNGYMIDKSSGGQRLLMVPPFWDRVMQRAFAQVFSARLESIMSSHSYGFRKGRSRISAKFDIQTAYREGYQWVYESDIEDFFNQLDIDRLMVRLQGLFYNDPALQWIKKWMLAPLLFKGKKYQRSIGLPQGSPLSPVLANLFLDDFDNDMKALGFRLVRFADDFVILCKTKEQAEQAALEVEKSLSEHGLSLNKEKTSIRTMEQGFYYLGYLFVNDMVINAKMPSINNSNVPAEIAERFHLGQAQEIKKSIHPPKEDKDKLSIISKNENEHGIVLCLQGKLKWLSLTQGRLCVMHKESKVSEQPLSHIQAIILMGNHQISTQCVHATLERNIPIYYASSYGKFIGASWSYQPQL
jgi:group II intron reverse transcriptase/maturase